MINEVEQELLFRYLDGDSSEHENLQLEKLLALSPELRSLKADMLDIRRAASLPQEDCSAHLEEAIGSRIAAQYPPSPRLGSRSAWEPLSMLRVAALLIVAIGAASLFYAGNRFSDEQAIGDRSVEQVLGDVYLAQDQYRAAIAELESLASLRLEQLPGDLALVYAENLEIVDDAILLFEANLDSGHSDSISYQRLSELYDRKIELLTSIFEV